MANLAPRDYRAGWPITQRYAPLHSIGNGTPGNTGTGGVETGGYGNPMCGSSQAGSGAATPLIGAPKS